MSYRQGEVLGRVERRRRFSLEQKVSVLGGMRAGRSDLGCGASALVLPSQVFK
jgi:hypothetical protein